MRANRARLGVSFVGAIVLSGLIAGACAGGPSDPKPVPSLASSPPAAVAFDEIRQAWSNGETNPAALRQLLVRFLVRFPNDGLIPLVRVYLALVAMQQGAMVTADQQLAACQSLPPGNAHDFWTVARARRLRLGGEPEPAFELLHPLVGKNVDPVTRTVFEEELTLCALATRRDYEAISYMDAWLRASREEDKSRTLATVSALVQRLPIQVLVSTIHAMRTQRASLGYGVDIERVLAERLANAANESGDAELARMLLDPSAGALVIEAEAGAALSELAASRRGLNVVQGRTIGLLLPTESPELRDESADVLRGVMWALGLPRGLRNLPGHPSTRSNYGDPLPMGGGCAQRESAPPLDDPRPEEGLRLVTRDDAGSADRTEVSLDELVGEGAAVVIAGLDAQTAARAVHWGESHRVAVVALEPPSDRQERSFGFVLGESRETAIEALAHAAPSIATQPVAPVIDASEVQFYAPAGGRIGPLTLLPPISCDIPATRAGDLRFPIPEWDHKKMRAWLVSGSPRCATDLVGELSTAHARGVVALTLGAAALPAHASGLRVVSASAGLIPVDAASDPHDDELERFSATLGTVTWWTALGRDAATLARVAVNQLPTEAATDLRTVIDRRAHARDLLAAARAGLWTSERTAWTAAHTMQRTVCAVDAPVK